VKLRLVWRSAWDINSLDHRTTLAFYFDLVSQTSALSKQPAIVQFMTRYQHTSGFFRFRVTTVRYPISEQGNVAKFIIGFDQETAAATMARHAISKSETEGPLEVVRWLDRNLIRLAAKFGEYHNYRRLSGYVVSLRYFLNSFTIYASLNSFRPSTCRLTKVPITALSSSEITSATPC
jgi:hypothetical protein